MPDSLLSKIAIGTSAWSYPDWRGVLYPPKLAQNQWLGWYSRFFSAVEVDSTFYHLPSAKVTENWAATTPDDFTFTVKLSREITHHQRLRDADALVKKFVDGLEPLREKLGAILIQLPASFRPAGNEEALSHFITSLPADWPFAIEFRDPQWVERPGIARWLRDAGVTWAWTDTAPYEEQAPAITERFPQTTDRVYLRLLGDLDTKFRADGKRCIDCYDHLRWDRSPSIALWAKKVTQHLQGRDGDGAGRKHHRALLFAANHYEGCSPLTAQRLAEALGTSLELPTLEEPLAAAPQLELF